MRTKKELAVLLSRLQPFSTPNPRLEQYMTDSEIAATVLWHARMQGDIEDRTVADLGCGTGVLGIGALALGARHVTFVDIDPRALETLTRNLALLDELTGETHPDRTIIECDIARCATRADTVLQNPPFGTRDTGADTAFLEAAMRIAPVTYSFHKTSTQAHLARVVERQGKRITWHAPFAFPLKMTMRHHAKRVQRIEVTCLRIA